MLAKGHILLVDDEPVILELLQGFFLEVGYYVSVAASASDALQLVDRGYYDALICDVLMEEMDGFAIAAAARSKNEKIAVVFITGNPDQHDLIQAKKMSAPYLSKPVGLDTLSDALKEAFELITADDQPNPPLTENLKHYNSRLFA